MKLLDLHIEGFGKFNNKYVDFSDGINVVTGHNEAGKSTLHACIRAMLYGMERAKGVAALTDTYAHYKPWFGKSYGAVMRVEFEGRVYRIERDFLKDPIGCTIYDETGVEEISFADDFLSRMLCNMSADAYDNTISIGQLKSSADESMAQELKNYIINMDTTGSRALNCTKAKQYLNEKKLALSEKLEADAAKEYAANAGRIHTLESELGALKEGAGSSKELNDPSGEIKELEASVAENREFLRKHGVHSSTQAAENEEKFTKVLGEYEAENKKNAVKANRTLYIIFLVLAVAAVIFAAYLLGNRTDYVLINRVLMGCVAGVVLAIIFFIACISAKSRLGKKEKALSELLEAHCGFEAVTPERSERVKVTLHELKEIAAAVEEKEAKLAGLNQEKEAVDAAKADEEAFENAVKEINLLRKRNSILRQDIERNDEIHEELEAIDMALEKIEELAESMKDSLGIYLNAEASRYIKEITGGAYDSMGIDDDLNVYMNTQDRMVPIEQVSSGTSDQIYMALRIAGARLMQGGQDKLPLIFDDSFVNYDEERLASALEWLSGSYDGQVIIFSCHKREIMLLEENNIPFTKVEL